VSQPTQAQIDAANAYEALMVPALFGEWARRVADAAQIQAGERVLDVACVTATRPSLGTCTCRLTIGFSGRSAAEPARQSRNDLT